MITNPKGTSLKNHWSWWRLIIIGLNVIALVLSAVMSWHYLIGGSMVGCSGGSPCDLVLNSQWSTIAGILPISGLAVGIYLALLVACLFIGPSTETAIRELAWRIMLIIVGAIAGSAIWFTIVQKWIIGDFCPYCMTTHIIGLLLAALVIWRATKEFASQSQHISNKNQKMTKKNISRPLKVFGLVFIGLGLAGILSAFQVIFTPPSVYSGGESQENIVTIDYHAAPIVGSPDAPYVITLLFDYQCPHCQKIHFLLDEVVQRYAGKVAFVLCPAPLNTKCNPYVPRDIDAFKNSCELAKIGLAVWFANREAFPGFENWIFSFDSGDRWQPRSLDAVKAKAIELVGQAKFDVAMSDKRVENYLQTSVEIYGKTIQNGKGGVPKLVFGSRWVIPETSSTDDLISILQKSLGLPKPE
ncbi:MAG TPA: vitamin K epoxide reductase family protein [Paludibacter sp.]